MAGKSRGMPFRVVAAYDTETCNVGTGPDTRSYPILFILNDFTDVPLEEYKPDDPREIVTFDRTLDTFMPRLFNLMDAGRRNGYVPVVCAYNLMFDMQTLMATFAGVAVLKLNAQSSTNVYTIDVYANQQDADNDGRPLMRFWDTFFLEQNGLKAMGETAGVAKATGDWDYSKIRTPETPLTDLELFYAKRDVQVIPAYLRYLLRSNEWMTSDMLGSRVLTKTSTVRQMALRTLGSVRVGESKGKRRAPTMLRRFEYLCHDELPKDYDTYALRKACFRGGFTFTSAAFATKCMQGVVSTDVTSMHHTFINGRMIPVGFTRMSAADLQYLADRVVRTPLRNVLERYYRPFDGAFHARIRFDNIRLRAGSPFEAWGVALTPRGKFARHAAGVDYWQDDPAAVAAENATRDNGWLDDADRPVFAFGKLYSAAHALIHVNEIELWSMAQVYEWDSMIVLCGEGTVKWKFPPDYVALQSNMLFERKSDCKYMTTHYETGIPFTGDIPASIPEGLANEMRKGTMDAGFLNSYYNGTVKGQFNSIYGTMAQDIFKPGYGVDEGGEIYVDQTTIATRENFATKIPKRCRVLYTYGMRIVAGSRMHLTIAMLLIWNAFHGRVKATGGDTDSIKMSVPDDVTDQQISDALKPALDAATAAIDYCMRPLRDSYPQWASKLTHVGGFEVENAGARYEHHMEYWNKARVSERDGVFHVTMAGLSRPLGAYHIEHIMHDLHAAGYPVEQVMRLTLGYNVEVASEACFSLQTYRPKPGDVYDRDIIDYEGTETRVLALQAVALYPTDRTLGDTGKPSNMENVIWLRRHGIDVETGLRRVEVRDMTPYVVGGLDGETILMKGVRHEQA